MQTRARPSCLTAEDRYLTVLRAIARGRLSAGRPLPGTMAQAMAREVLIEMNADWTKLGSSVQRDGAETNP